MEQENLTVEDPTAQDELVNEDSDAGTEFPEDQELSDILPELDDKETAE
ncbi:hypothetical protein [Boudabousia marimammalium]|nr:hypothetical protein [Boudabousia marimammalium]